MAVGRILDRYIFREVATTWLGVTAVLLVILLTNQVARVLDRAAEGQFPRSVVLELIALKFPGRVLLRYVHLAIIIRL